MKLGLNLLLACVALVVALVALEGAARVYPRLRDCRVMKSQLDSLVDDDGISKDAVNVYYFGGSTLVQRFLGVSLVSVVDSVLGGEVDGLPVRSINLAANGRDLDYNLHRLRGIVQRKDTFHPSIVVVYSGHNEFLKHHPDFGSVSFSPVIAWVMRHSRLAEYLASRFGLYHFEARERRLFDEPLFSEGDYQAVVRRYQEGLLEAVDLVQANQVPMVISTLVANYADWEPNRSVPCDDGEEKQLEALLEDARGAEARSQYRTAIDIYNAALALCDRFAETHYRLAKAYEQIGQLDPAWNSYLQAVAYDRMPIRALPAQNDFIRQLAQYENVTVVDAVQVLRDQSETGLVGFNFMIDGHHPNPRGYLAIGRALGRAIERRLRGDSRTEDGPDGGHLEAPQAVAAEGWTLFDRHIWTGQWFVRMSTWRYDPTERLRLAEEAFVRARQLRPDRSEPYLGLATVELLRRDNGQAQRFFAEARGIDADAVAEYLELPWVRAAIRFSRGPERQDE